MGFVAFLLWVFGCLGLYFWKIPPHPFLSLQYFFLPFKTSQRNWAQVFQAWLNHGYFLISFTGTLIVVMGTGNRMLRLVGRWAFNPVEEWVWSLALGWLFWGLLASGLAVEKLFYLHLLMVIGLLVLFFFIVMDRWESVIRCWSFSGFPNLPLLWSISAGLIALLSLTNLLAPEMSWDAMTYQLILPKFYFLNHGFYPAQGMVPAHYPSLGQMFFSWGLLWGNDSLARSFCFLAHLGTALALVTLGTRLENVKAGWFAAMFYWAFPYLNIFSTRGYVDLFAGYYAVLGLGALILFTVKPIGDSSEPEIKETRIFWFLGLVALGATWGIKYNAIAFWLAGAAILFLATLKNPLKKRIWIGMVVVPIFFFGFWALKSWAYTGNPVFPYFSNVFETFGWTDFDQKASAIKFQIEGWDGVVKIPEVLWGIFFKNYSGAANEEISLIPLLLLPLLWFGGKRVAWKIPLLAAILIPFFFWLVTSHQLRLISVVAALIALLLGFAYERALENWSSYAGSLNLFFGFYFLILAFYLFQGLVQQPNPFACFLGFQSRSEFLNGVLRPKGYMQVAGDLNHVLPEDAKILILGQQNGYYLERVSIFDFDYNYPGLKRLTEKSSTPESLYSQFRKNGITHILYNANSMLGTGIRVEGLGVDRFHWKPEELKNYEQFFLKYTRKMPLPVAEGYALYEVAPREGFSSFPEYLPGTELYYLKNMQEAMGLPKLSDMVGKSIPSGAYLKSYEGVADQHPELGYSCFQWAFAQLASHPESFREALKRGEEGFRRNGDKASWLTLQGDVFLIQKKISQAISSLEEAEKLSPEREDVARNLAFAYYNEHDLKKALSEAERAAALAPFSEEYQQLALRLKSAFSSQVR